MDNKIPYITRNEIEISAAFTGYRHHKLPFGSNFNHPDAIRLRAALKAEYDNLIQRGFRIFYTGGAVGCDMMAAEVILELMEEYSDRCRIIHYLCLPCLNHDAKWNEADKERLRRIKAKSEVIYVSEKPYFNGCMQMRNTYMVDRARVLIAVFDGQKGGTFNTVEYAKRNDKKVVMFNPQIHTRVELVAAPEDAELMLING